MSDLNWQKSACNLCYINCGVELGLAGTGSTAKVVKVRGDKQNPKSRGYLCNKAQGIPNYLYHRDRLTSPLRRRADGGFEPVTWETALSEIAGKLSAIAQQRGGQSLALYGGGGQGNHAGGAYATAFLRGLGSRNVFNALAQEKTGDFWVNGHLFGAQTCHTAEDIEHCDLLLVLGANPWLAHGFANARLALNAIQKDPSRHLIVVDPRRSETAEMADLHLQLRPGTDAFLLAALLATLAQRGAFNQPFIAAHTAGFAEVAAVLAAVPIEEYAATADVPLSLIAQAAEMIMAADRMVVRAELGIQQGRHSTLNSYLEKLLFLLTGHFGRRGTNTLHSWLAPLWGNGRGQVYAPTNTEVIAGLLPPNLLPEAILGEHPDRLRGLWVDSSNPANTAADTQQVLKALQALELLVVVDVAFTETAQLAHYVLPASSQYEKCEYTLFSLEAPTNFFQVRAPVIAPLEGTLAEPAIYARLSAALGMLPDEATLASLKLAATAGLASFGTAFQTFIKAQPEFGAVIPIVLYHTLGPSLPDDTAAAAPLWLAAQQLARRHAGAVRKALGEHAPTADANLGDALFMQVVSARSGLAFSTHDTVWSLLEHADQKIHLAIPRLLDALQALTPAEAAPDPDFPFLLSAGQRRLQNANQNFRGPGFRKVDPDGALYIHPDDLQALGLSDAAWLAVESARSRLIVRARCEAGLRRGYLVLPHGYGQSYPSGAAGERVVCGPRINMLTDSQYRDPIAGTPYHKAVPVRLAVPTASERSAAERNSARVIADQQA